MWKHLSICGALTLCAPGALATFATSVSPGDKRFSPALAWKKLAPGASERFAFTAVNDEKRGSALVFAGETSKSGQFDVLHDLWEYKHDGDRWQAVTIEGEAPPERAYHAATFDPKREAMWVFGGATREFTPLGDLWRLDTEKMKWTQLVPSGDKPEPRFNGALHYDARRDQLVLHSGCKAFFEGDNAWPDVWVYDIEKNAWSRKPSAAPARWQSASVIAPELDALIVHGGFDGASTVKGDTWMYSLANDKWTELGKGFKATDAHAAVWDATAKAMVVYGGATGAKSGLDEVWAFDPKTKKWAELAIKGDGPGARAYHAVVLNEAQGSMWVFGGTVNQFNDPMRTNEPWMIKLH